MCLNIILLYLNVKITCAGTFIFRAKWDLGFMITYKTTPQINKYPSVCNEKPPQMGYWGRIMYFEWKK